MKHSRVIAVLLALTCVLTLFLAGCNDNPSATSGTATVPVTATATVTQSATATAGTITNTPTAQTSPTPDLVTQTPTAEVPTTEAPSQQVTATPTNKPADKPTPTPTPTPTSPYKKAAYMNAGDTYKVLIWDNAAENDYLKRDDAIRQQYDKITTTYGVKIKFIVSPGDNWLSNALSSAAAQSPICDILHCGGPFAIPTISTYGGSTFANYIANLSDYSKISFSNNGYWNTATQKSAGTYGGKLYFAVPQLIGYSEVSLNQVTIFNKKILADNGYSAQTMYNLSQNGQWTFNKFKEVAAACSDGYSTYGLCAGADCMTLLSMITSNGGELIYTTSSSQIPKFGNTKAKTMNAIEFFLDMAQSDIININNASSQDALTQFVSGKTAMMLTYVNRTEQLKEYEKLDFGVIMPPKGNDQSNYISDINWYTPLCVFKSSKNPAGAAECMNMLFAPNMSVSESHTKKLMQTQAKKYLCDDQSMKTLEALPGVSKHTEYMLAWDLSYNNYSLAYAMYSVPNNYYYDDVESGFIDLKPHIETALKNFYKYK